MSETTRLSPGTQPTEQGGPPSGRVLVGVDGSEGSLAALRFALEQAGLRGTTLLAVMGFTHHPSWASPQIESLYPPNVVLPNANQPVRKHPLDRGYTSEAGEEGAVHNELDRAVEKVLAEGGYDKVTVITQAVDEHPAQALLGLAKAGDLIVVGSRGYGGFKGALLGSVSQHVVNHATCPVVVVPYGR